MGPRASQTALKRLLGMRDYKRIRLNLHHLPRLECGKALARNVRFIERGLQGGERRVDRFIGQLKRAVVMRQCLLGATIGQRFHGVGRIHVLIAHEPARLIGADRQDRQPQRTVRLPDVAEMLAVAVAGIADDVDLARRRLQHKTCP